MKGEQIEIPREEDKRGKNKLWGIEKVVGGGEGSLQCCRCLVVAAARPTNGTWFARACRCVAHGSGHYCALCSIAIAQSTASFLLPLFHLSPPSPCHCASGCPWCCCCWCCWCCCWCWCCCCWCSFSHFSHPCQFVGCKCKEPPNPPPKQKEKGEHRTLCLP